MPSCVSKSANSSSRLPESFNGPLIFSSIAHQNSLLTRVPCLQALKNFAFGHAIDALQKDSGLFHKSGFRLVGDHESGQCGYSWLFENNSQRQFNAEDFAQASHQLRRQQRMSAQFKKIMF